MSWCPPVPAIFASRNCAKVKVTWDLWVGGGLAWCWKTLDRNWGWSWSFIAKCGRPVFGRLQVTENRDEILPFPRYQLTARASFYASLRWLNQISKLEHGRITLTSSTTVHDGRWAALEPIQYVWAHFLRARTFFSALKEWYLTWCWTWT